MTQEEMNRNIKPSARTLYFGVSVCLRLIGRAVGLLVASAQITPAKDESSSSISGGVLNYRKGKLDDGTDPYGWYERD